jgi:hypothetical protein
MSSRKSIILYKMYVISCFLKFKTVILTLLAYKMPDSVVLTKAIGTWKTPFELFYAFPSK